MSDYRPVILTILLMGAVILLQTTVLGVVAVGGVTPDLQLILLVFLALRRGSMSGQVAGFAGGLLEDLVSLAPLGFHALVRTLVGYSAGLLHETLRTDEVAVAVLTVVGATLVKGLASALLGLIFDVRPDLHLLEGRFWIEAAYGALLAPFLFALLGRVRLLRASGREGKS